MGLSDRFSEESPPCLTQSGLQAGSTPVLKSQPYISLANISEVFDGPWDLP